MILKELVQLNEAVKAPKMLDFDYADNLDELMANGYAKKAWKIKTGLDSSEGATDLVGVYLTKGWNTRGLPVDSYGDARIVKPAVDKTIVATAILPSGEAQNAEPWMYKQPVSGAQAREWYIAELKKYES